MENIPRSFSSLLFASTRMHVRTHVPANHWLAMNVMARQRPLHRARHPLGRGYSVPGRVVQDGCTENVIFAKRSTR
jgi:hypothetical protein